MNPLRRLSAWTFAAAAFAVCGGPALARAQATVEEGSAERQPWSGYWWPVAKGELLGPLENYDLLTGARAHAWELANNPPGEDVPGWHGYCHAWAAASLVEREPAIGRRLRDRQGQPLLAGIDDQKGWLTACHSADASTTYGDRFGDGVGSDRQDDMAPELVWQVLQMFLRDNRLGLVMDLDPGEEVWNYPVFAYRLEHRPSPRGGGWREGKLVLWAADDAVPPWFVGVVPHVETYDFEFRLAGGAVVAGSSRWLGPAVENHPDFAWYPYAVQSSNPELHHALVRRALQDGEEVEIPPPDEPGEEPGEEPAPPGVPGGAPGGLPGRPPVAGLPGGASGPEGAGPVALSPTQLVASIAGRTSGFGLDASFAEFGKTRFQVGEQIPLDVTCERAGCLYVLHVDPLGELSLLYPPAGRTAPVQAGEKVRIPAQGGLPIRGPFGNHCLKIVITEQPLLLTGLDYTPHGKPPFGKPPKPGPAPPVGTPPVPPKPGPPKPGPRPPADGPAVGQEHGPAPKPGCGFRLCPSRRRWMKELLTDYVQGKEIDPARYGAFDAAKALPGFAQDEITYYVGPTE